MTPLKLSADALGAADADALGAADAVALGAAELGAAELGAAVAVALGAAVGAAELGAAVGAGVGAAVMTGLGVAEAPQAARNAALAGSAMPARRIWRRDSRRFARSDGVRGWSATRMLLLR
ncbi:MAG TPA: hypothetical protein VNF73_10310 [Candidatus Saccharimonadales bacterium]|nr:hypothetical protein [Candidatus Saccharimonadales bacterium]